MYTMPSIFCDDEEVTFTDDIPSDPSQIFELLMGAVSEQGRAVVKFLVDENDALEQGAFPSEYQKIEAYTLTHDELTMRLVIEAMNQLSEIEPQLDAYVKNILSVAWSEVFKRMDELISRIKPFAELIDNLGPYVSTYSPPWSEDFSNLAQKQSESLNSILSAFEKGDPALLSDELSVNYIPVFKSTRKLFRDTIIPFLKKKVDAELLQKKNPSDS